MDMDFGEHVSFHFAGRYFHFVGFNFFIGEQRGRFYWLFLKEEMDKVEPVPVENVSFNNG